MLRGRRRRPDRVVDADGGQLRQISTTVSGEAGLTFAP